ncbi:putative mediator of RNA polymerase II transcription subunit 12 [Teleopsis dalmanni]|uniref:putative mediator of RNA polymerase II transcription subunit 12 n=1 Tax=Teleopsis dalmanni TaxID=139649 RepID=UPI0018CF66BF|nr:putative mediator of RNA polymerase II transcription subunit 12 [Teleopsis dalmanni]
MNENASTRNMFDLTVGDEKLGKRYEPYHQFPATEITTKTTVKTTKEVNSQPTAKTKSSQKIKQQKQQKQRKQCKNEDFRISTEETYNDEVNLPPTPNDSTANGNPKEIELQILWLEKVYAINKQLQREEEILVKLHAKIRKHQVKRAYQTKNEVLQQIDKLDTEIALQCCDISKVEDNLMTTDEQLKQKLTILEKLNEEFDATTTATTTTTTTMNAQPIGFALLTAANKVGEDLDEITEIKDAVSSCDIKANCSPVTCNANSFEANKLTQPQQRQQHQQQPQQQHNNVNNIMANKITTPTAAITITTAAGVTTHYTPTISSMVGYTQENKVLHDSTTTTQALMTTATTYTVSPQLATKTEVTETVNAVATFQTQIPKVNLNEIYTPEDLQNLQKLIAKPADTTVAAQTRTALPILMPIAATSTATVAAATYLPQEPTIKTVQQHSNYPISGINHNDGSVGCITDTYSTMSSNVLTLQQTHTTTEQHLPQQHQLQQQQQHQHQQQPPPLLIDKNILPLHVNNVKTVKKQMFCPKSLNSPTSIAIRHNNNNNSNNSSSQQQQQQQQQQQPQHYIQQSSSNYVSGMLPLSTMPTQVQQLIPAPLNVKNIDITRMGTLV